MIFWGKVSNGFLGKVSDDFLGEVCYFAKALELIAFLTRNRLYFSSRVNFSGNALILFLGEGFK